MRDFALTSGASNNKAINGLEKEDELLSQSSILPSRKKRKQIRKSALIHFRSFDVPLVSPTTGSILTSIRLEADRPYVVGRASGHCDLLVRDSRVSKRHCQILFDGLHRKVYILDGSFLLPDGHAAVSEFRKRILSYNQLGGEEAVNMGCSGIQNSSNGVFVNGVRVETGVVRELCAGDEVLFVCGNEGICSLGVRIGFVIQGVVLTEEVIWGLDRAQFERRRKRLDEKTASMGHSQRSISAGKRSKRVFAFSEGEIMSPCNESWRPGYGVIARRAKSLLSQCLHILHSDDPMSYIRQLALQEVGMNAQSCVKNGSSSQPCMNLLDTTEDPMKGGALFTSGEEHPIRSPYVHDDKQNSEGKGDDRQCISDRGGQMHKIQNLTLPSERAAKNATSGVPLLPNWNERNSTPVQPAHVNTSEDQMRPPGKKFYLNRLQFMDHPSSTNHNTISLPELLYPVHSIMRIFIATFTSDILWFLKYCGIPYELPVTIACHDTERCWSSSPGQRSSKPYPEYPNLEVVFPPFPEAIAFGKDLKKKGIGCHHPKLLVLQRDNSLRVIITSANLVPNQWNHVTNTIWWQDFPVRSEPDVSSLFRRMPNGEATQTSSDFAAQLARFMASLVIDVPTQAHWVAELTKYDFEGAVCHIIASIPGIHSYRTEYTSRCKLASPVVDSLGWAEASVVGLSHLFHSRSDIKGIQLKSLASFLSRTRETVDGMCEVVLRRNMSVVADANAVSVLVSNPDHASEGDCIQLGFLPRCVAKWVSPLWDDGFFSFSGYVSPKEALAVALGGSSNIVQLRLYVLQGPRFADMMKLLQFKHVIALCSLIASLQSCTGLWRLEEILGRYKWPESQQSDFIYGASSIGSVSAQFVSAFSAAAGKRSSNLPDSEESDPEWGCWSASQELRNPSMKILFPTIDRVKKAHGGILSSRRILCFSEKTWQKLRTANIFRDAVPHPHERVGHPMHVKVARRQFWRGTQEASVGWVYCGSHNFSAAAWGQTISNSSSGPKLRVCNYELGIIFVFPPTDDGSNQDQESLKDIVLPFAVPAPEYRPTDRPATARAMREALSELTEYHARQAREELARIEETQEVPDDEEEEEDTEANKYGLEEKEEEKAYAEMLWIEVDSSQSSLSGT
ncbi:unnamed protein product [Linum tenue]|uniref:FHA domain-containing protein n=1 Tax=Linum tenue TaxID=586396 RepID=A0AAV0QV13_9ROSI|nr:unnamed protein product [Linum tenue]